MSCAQNRRKTMKKLSKIFILVCVLALVFALTSCELLEQYGITIPGFGPGNDTGDSENEPPEEKDGELLLIHNSKAYFNVVYTQKSGASAKRAADKFVKDLRTFGVEVADAISDKDASLVTEREIIIGADALNRGEDCSITETYLGADGQAVKIVGKKIIIAGGTPELTAKAFDVYVKTQMKISSKTKTLETLSVKDDYSYEKLTEYAIESIKLGNTDLGDYTLVYDLAGLDNLNYTYIKITSFATSIFDKSGIVIKEGKLDSISSYDHALVIRYVDTYVGDRRDKSHELEMAGGFRAYLAGNNYVVECCYANVFEDIFNEYVSNTFLTRKGKIVVNEDYTDEANTVYYEDFGAKGNGNTDDFEAMYAAHIFANKCGQTVKGTKGAHYFVGAASLNRTIPVMTDVNFNGATITVDDVGSAAYKNRSVKLFTTQRQYNAVSISGDAIDELYNEYRKANPDAPEKLVVDIDTESFPWLASVLEAPSMVRLISSKHKDFVRHGANQNSGSNRMDVFMVDENGDFIRETDTDLDGNGVIGNVTTPVAYSFGSTDVDDPSVTNSKIDSSITQIVIYRCDDEPITIENGKFYNICCRAVAETEFKVKYHAYNRGFELYRSNVTIKDIKHRMQKEPDMHIIQSPATHECDLGSGTVCQKFGSRQESYPYYGFFLIQYTSNLNIRDCNLTGHTTYYEEKPATGSTGGKIPDPVAAGSYDYVVERSCNVSFYNVTQGFSEDPAKPGEELNTGLGDSRYWGIMSSNGSKNLRFEKCAVNRFDAHQGFWNATLIDTTIGHSFNVVGGGTLNAIGVTKVTGTSFISLRSDYGATFRGDMNLIDCNFLNYKAYNTSRGGVSSTVVNSSGTIINAGFATTSKGYRTPEQRQESYDAEYKRVYDDKMEGFAEAIANGTKTEERAIADATAAAKTAAEKISMQGGYWLWDFGYDCYLPKNITIRSFQSAGTKNLYLLPKLPDEVFTYNYDPEKETASSVTNVYNITERVNIVGEKADMPIAIKVCSSTDKNKYSKLLAIPFYYGSEWNDPFGLDNH